MEGRGCYIARCHFCIQWYLLKVQHAKSNDASRTSPQKTFIHWQMGISLQRASPETWMAMQHTHERGDERRETNVSTNRRPQGKVRFGCDLDIIDSSESMTCPLHYYVIVRGTSTYVFSIIIWTRMTLNTQFLSALLDL